MFPYCATFTYVSKDNTGDLAPQQNAAPDVHRTTTSLDSPGLPGSSLRAIVRSPVINQQSIAWKTIQPQWYCVISGFLGDLRAWYPSTTSLLPKSSKAVPTFLQQQGIIKMDQSAYPPDCNPIEHLWDELGLVGSSIENLFRAWVIFDGMCWISAVNSLQNSAMLSGQHASCT